MSYKDFMRTVEELGNVNEIRSVLHWDQEVQMPEEGVKARSRQLSTLARIEHRTLASDELHDHVEQLEREELDRDQEAVLREVKREHERAREVPVELLQDIAEKESECLDTWKEAREKGDFSIVEEELAELVELKRDYAEKVNADKEAYQVLFEDYEPYISFDRMEEILEQLKEELTELLERIREDGVEIESSAFRGDFDRERQKEFNEKVLELLGYDRARAKLNVSEHPFTVGNQFDTRITTRYNTEDLSESVMPTIHEYGHALYCLGLDQDNYGNPLGQARDLAVHESQSRLWENHVGRSRQFWEFLLPEVREAFPGQMEGVSVEDCYESVNRYDPENLVRVHADEASYHLHIILRFELERKLVNGEIEVEELPRLWNKKMEDLLGVAPGTESEGVLQDIHWYQGSIGYFPTYSLGSVISAQIFETAKDEIDNMDEKIERGEFEELQDWLRENIHSEGKRYRTGQLIEKITGSKPSAEPFLDYIREKYSELYGLE
ncbi:MAG: carboxypeptidase M32 [Candidatus Nanohaloarchaea archaeon]